MRLSAGELFPGSFFSCGRLHSLWLFIESSSLKPPFCFLKNYLIIVSMRILLADVDVRNSQALAEFLQKNHFGIDTVYTGTEVVEYASSGIYDVLVIEAGLPKADGLEAVRILRGKKNYVPVLLMSENPSAGDIVEGLDSGADDYIRRPFSFEEFLARIKALARRKGEFKPSTVSVGNFMLDKNSCEIKNSCGESMKISLKELLILSLLFEFPHQIVKKELIIEKIWGGDSAAEYNNVEVYISFIRKKMERLNVNARIRTARGIGYSLEEIA